MWVRRIMGNVSLPWLLVAMVLCVAAFVVGVMMTGLPERPITAEEHPTPHVPRPPLDTPRPPEYTAEERRMHYFESSTPTPRPAGTVRSEPADGPQTAGSTIKFLNGRTIELPSDVYIARRLDKITCNASKWPCIKTPAYVLDRGGVEIMLDGNGNLAPGRNEGVDMSKFSFLTNNNESSP